MKAKPKCPKCERAIKEFEVQYMVVNAKATVEPGIFSAVVCCPHCMTIISLVAETHAIAADVVRRLQVK